MGRHNSKCVGPKERRDLINFITERGYELKPGNGSGHEIYKSKWTGKVHPIPVHLNKMVARRIHKEVAMEEIIYGRENGITV